MRARPRLSGILLLGLLTACTQTQVFKVDGFNGSTQRERVLLLPADVQITEMSLGGVETPMAEWTEQAVTHLGNALERRLAGRQLGLVRYDPARSANPELLTLGKIVGGSIIAFKYGASGEVLPTLKVGFDWSLGPRSAELGNAYEADFGLVLAFRDGFAAPERAAASVGLAVLGVALPQPFQIGYAYLVDLRTGQVVWFNRMQFQRGLTGMNDPRESSGAQSVLDNLLKDFPL